ncbi:N-acetylmuramic acid 6-phosphate etherase [Clostridium sp. FP2]|uniref:N-acetylmuramic acid 6-phosphate etherase n=1 Tax=Clostridium TaxID=1485 RepID=UPI0013E8F94A|nr:MULTISPECIES: N-acetylmuramic acid 6-phosphate etherase [Clostridium]MBW9156713.1 N-acetylmuramic acid 6-phosphate etherase [Clostridium tagluense]MBZ9625080.1 N-acetylmuramic acid 6-phosphate etherase [Clostridium sp. FP2]WLC64871.1 N-acetylmuramic acid 6-phosphate etherase [Clostridium tagluense]
MEKNKVDESNLDKLSIFEILKKVNDEDKKVAIAIEKELSNIEKSVELILQSFEEGGRLFYIGSGTSGKLGVMDASECPPTFGTPDTMVQGIISGGVEALSGWLEHTEDNPELAINDLKMVNINKKDVLVGITASGNTPYVVAAMEYAKAVGSKTIALICNSKGKIKDICEVAINIEVGPEVILGSTRMKAGTAQKMVLNMLSTVAMIKTGKTYSNLMVNVRPINKKLKQRVREIVKLATGVDDSKVNEILEICEYDPKVCIVKIKSDVTVEKAKEALDKTKGNVAKALAIL